MYSCNNSKVEINTFDNSVCLELANQSGYPIEICDCVQKRALQIKKFTEIQYEDIELLVNDCVQSNLGLGF